MIISKFLGKIAQAGAGGLQTAVGLATGIAGAVRGRKARKRMLRSIRQELKDNQQIFDRDYYGDYLNRSENLAALRNLKKMYLENSGSGAGAVVGATPAQQAAMQGRIGNHVADATSNIAGNTSTVRDRAMSRYMAAKGKYYGTQQDLLSVQAQNAAELARQGFISAGQGIVNTMNSLGK